MLALGTVEVTNCMWSQHCRKSCENGRFFASLKSSRHRELKEDKKCQEIAVVNSEEGKKESKNQLRHRRRRCPYKGIKDCPSRARYRQDEDSIAGAVGRESSPITKPLQYRPSRSLGYRQLRKSRRSAIRISILSFAREPETFPKSTLHPQEYWRHTTGNTWRIRGF